MLRTLLTHYGLVADAAAEKLANIPKKSDCFLINTTVNKAAKYRRGRPKKGDFVLLSNLNSPAERDAWSAEALLRLYKNQIGIE